MWFIVYTRRLVYSVRKNTKECSLVDPGMTLSYNEIRVCIALWRYVDCVKEDQQRFVCYRFYPLSIAATLNPETQTQEDLTFEGTFVLQSTLPTHGKVKISCNGCLDCVNTKSVFQRIYRHSIQRANIFIQTTKRSLHIEKA